MFSRLDANVFWSVVIGVFVGLFTLVTMAYRWQILLKLKGYQEIPYANAFSGYLSGAFFSIFLPGAIGGDVFRIKYLADLIGISLKKSTMIALIERVFGLTSLAIIFAVGLWFSFDLLSEQIEIGNFSWVLIILLPLFVYIKYKISKYININYKYYILVLSVSALSPLADIALVYLFLSVLNSTVSFVFLLSIMPIVYISTALPISIGGLGVREGVLSGLLVLYSVDPSISIMASLMLFMSKIMLAAIGAPGSIKYIKDYKVN